jgi:hypothetical protein
LFNSRVEIKTHRKISNRFQQCCCIYSTSGWQSLKG